MLVSHVRPKLKGERAITATPAEAVEAPEVEAWELSHPRPDRYGRPAA